MRIAIARSGESGTAGLTSAYQRTNVTTVGALAVKETGGFILVGVTPVPWYSPLPLAEPFVSIEPSVAARGQDELAEGYQAMAAENSLLAEESLNATVEVWPA